MKNLSIVLNVVLFVAVIVLYVLYFSGHKSPETVKLPVLPMQQKLYISTRIHF